MPDSQERFRGGPMAACSWELDALYFGTVYENNRRMREWMRKNAQHRAEMLARGETPEDLPRPPFLDTKQWITLLHLIEDVHSIPGNANPFKAVNFRLDVLRMLAQLPESRIRAFVLYMDGYSLDEIAQKMGKDPESGEPWDYRSVRDALKKASRTIRKHGDALLDEPTKRYLGVPRTEQAGDAELLVEIVRSEALHLGRRASRLRKDLKKRRSERSKRASKPALEVV